MYLEVCEDPKINLRNSLTISESRPLDENKIHLRLRPIRYIHPSRVAVQFR